MTVGMWVFTIIVMGIVVLAIMTSGWSTQPQKTNNLSSFVAPI